MASAAIPILHEKQKCFLLILVMTAVVSKNREAVRDTWFKEARRLQLSEVQAKFVIDTQGLPEKSASKTQC